MEALAGAPAGQRAADFRTSLSSDRDAVIIAIGASWFGLLAGFVPDMLAKFAKGTHYVPATHFHAASAFLWMSLLTWQALLVRRDRLVQHRANGKRIGKWLAAIVALSALATVWTADRAHLAAGEMKVAGLAFQLGHIIPFIVLTGIALSNTNRPDLHKRLLLLGVFAILDTGWSRWIGAETRGLIGDGFAGQVFGRFPLTWALTAGMGVYDTMTRGRLHPAYLPAVGLMLVTQFGAGLLFIAPWWPPVALRILGL